MAKICFPRDGIINGLNSYDDDAYQYLTCDKLFFAQTISWQIYLITVNLLVNKDHWGFMK